MPKFLKITAHSSILSLIILIAFSSFWGCNTETHNKSEIKKNGKQEASDLTPGDFSSSVFYFSKDSSEVHFFAWTGWRNLKIAPFYEDSIQMWIKKHPDYTIIPVLKMNETGKKNENIYLSWFIDYESSDTLQIYAIRKGWIFAGHFLPILDSAFHSDTCYKNSKDYSLMAECEDFKNYVNKVSEIHNNLDSTKIKY